MQKLVQVLGAGTYLLLTPMPQAKDTQLRGKILYVRHEAKADALWATRADGKEQVLVGRFPQFTLSGGTPINLSEQRLYTQERLWNGNGPSRRAVGNVFVSYRLNGRDRLVLKQLRDVKPATFNISGPILSPNGGRLAYSVARFGSQGLESSEVRTIGTDSRGDRLVIRRNKPLMARRAIAWSRDGRRLLLREWRIAFRSAGAGAEPNWLVCDASSGKIVSSSKGLLPSSLAGWDAPLISRDGRWAVVPGQHDKKASQSLPERRDLRTGATFPLTLPVRVGPFEVFWSGDGRHFALWWMRTGPSFEESTRGQREEPGPRTGIDIFTREGKRLRTLATNVELVAWLP